MTVREDCDEIDDRKTGEPFSGAENWLRSCHKLLNLKQLALPQEVLWGFMRGELPRRFSRWINKTTAMNKKNIAKNTQIKSSLMNKKPQWGAFIGTSLEYYDSALFWFMTPLLTPLFLPNMDPLSALILAYATYPLTIVSRPLGAILLGRIGDKYGRKKALTVSLIGTAAATGIVGCLPTYASIGAMAPMLFTLLRVVQKFFVAGEYNGGAIFLLEHTKDRKGFKSGMYCAFTASGILAAAIVCSLVSILPEGWWRLAYLLAFLTALFGIYFRFNATETPEFKLTQETELQPQTFRNKVTGHWCTMLICAGVATCFSSLYTIHSSFTIGYFPQITSFTTSQMMFMNIVSLTIYMISLPISGLLGDKLGYKRSMMYAAFMTAMLGFPLFLAVGTNTLSGIFTFKIIFSLMSAWFIGPFHAWAQELFPVNSRYQLISLSYSIGSQLGSLTPPLSLWLWKQTLVYYIPSVIVIGFSLIGIFSLSMMQEKTLEVSLERP